MIGNIFTGGFLVTRQANVVDSSRNYIKPTCRWYYYLHMSSLVWLY